MKNQESAADIVALFGQRAGNIYEARGYCCSEAVIYVLNQALGGPMSEEVAASLGSGFCHGMGGAGCVCGGLAEYFGVDATLIRLGWILLTFMTGIAPFVIAYIIAVVIIPEERAGTLTP